LTWTRTSYERSADCFTPGERLVKVTRTLSPTKDSALTYLIASLILPPGGPLLLIALGLLLVEPWPDAGYAFTMSGTLILYLLATPAVAYGLINTLQRRHPALTEIPAEAQAIVVLGGGRNPGADEYGGDTVEYFTLERLRYASRLHGRSGLPILVSGGEQYGEMRSEASMMKEALERDFKTPVCWAEGHSRDTYQNARNSARVLREHGVHRVLLVTHGWHMPRALWCFRRTGLSAIPAPTASDSARRGYRLVPHYRALYTASNALSEYLAIAWYLLRYSRR
jgi:uncharacterized SAM-binding protein YcdF (DUF218 family)